MKPIPLTLQTLYQDLLQAHLDRPPEEMAGSPHLRETGGKSFWYVTVRAPGGKHRQHFIGPDDKSTRERIERWKVARDDARAFRAQASEKAAALRAARLPALDMTTGKVLRALAQAGAFRLGGVLVGTHAFRLYDLELGMRVSSDATAITGDVMSPRSSVCRSASKITPSLNCRPCCMTSAWRLSVRSIRKSRRDGA